MVYGYLLPAYPPAYSFRKRAAYGSAYFRLSGGGLAELAFGVEPAA